jgi:putative nucleotidyltransferase with HDIG domain
MPFVPLQPCALRLGLFIKIDGSWFSHPFPTNTFKIKSSKDLETLRGLTNITLSDPESVQSEQPASLVPEPELEPNPDPVSSSLQEPDPPEEEIHEDPIQRKVVQFEAFRTYQEHLQKVGSQFQEVVQEGKHMLQDVNSRALLNLIGSNETDEEFFLHALNVCSLSLMIGQDLGFGREDKEKLALGALFHDVGELKYPAEKLLRKGFMPPSELKAFLDTHPKYGVEMVEKLPNFPFEAIEVIHQHHERLNGSGYPSGKKDEQISKFAKIVMVVDEYDELCHHPDPARSLIPSEALSYLYVKCRHTLWNEAVISLVKQLGVYPPGSLVHLSNQKVGIVTSVNMDKRLRPIILVYDEQQSPEEPIILNLAEEDESLSIVQAIRPSELALKIRECLNPRRIISYFPSTAPSEPVVDHLHSLAQST